MTILLSDTDNIVLGKIPYEPKWKLSVEAHAFLTKNEMIMQIDEKEKYPELINVPYLGISAYYDDVLIVRENVKNNVTAVKYLPDDQTTQSHVLEFELLNKTDDHSVVQGNDQISLVIGVKVKIDDLSVDFALFDNHMLFLGEPGQKFRVELRTPIYHWLVDNSNRIIQQIDL